MTSRGPGGDGSKFSIESGPPVSVNTAARMGLLLDRIDKREPTAACQARATGPSAATGDIGGDPARRCGRRSRRSVSCAAVPELRAIPRKHLAIITCMDARIDPQRSLGLELGDAHVLRNAGAVVSDDMLRSLVLSQRLLETRSVAVMAHTECGLRDVHDDELARQLERETGSAPPFAFGSFHDLDEH